MSNAVAKKSTTVPGLIAQSRERIADVLPPGHSADRVVKLARIAVHKNHALLKCDPISVVAAVMEASQLGLEIGRLAHLVPFGGKCQMVPDYKGLIDLAMRSDHILSIQAHIVYEDDHFTVWQGTEHGISHGPDLASTNRASANIVSVYAIAEIAKGGVKTSVHEVMTLDEVTAIRERSRAKSNGPWVTDFAAMAKKTVIKRLCKLLPQSPALGMAVELDNRHEVGSATAIIESDTEGGVARELAAKAEASRARLLSAASDEVESGEVESDD